MAEKANENDDPGGGGGVGGDGGGIGGGVGGGGGEGGGGGYEGGVTLTDEDAGFDQYVDAYNDANKSGHELNDPSDNDPARIQTTRRSTSLLRPLPSTTTHRSAPQPTPSTAGLAACKLRAGEPLKGSSPGPGGSARSIPPKRPCNSNKRWAQVASHHLPSPRLLQTKRRRKEEPVLGHR